MTLPRLDGLDIHDVYQPITDWAAATNYRLMSCKVTDGTARPRPGGLAYFRKFREHKVPLRGMYHWLRSTSPMATQIARLAEAIEALGGLQDGEFIQLDWETTPGIPNVSVAQVREWLQLADERWPDRTIVYASDWVPGFAEWRKGDPGRPLWYANYNTNPEKLTGGWVECSKWDADVWQWTSSAMVPGIATRCDGNHVFNWAALERIAHVAPAPAPREEDPPVVVAPPVRPPVVVAPPPLLTPLLGGVDVEVQELVSCKGAVFAVLGEDAKPPVLKVWIPNGEAVQHYGWAWKEQTGGRTHDGNQAVVREIDNLPTMHALGPVINAGTPAAPGRGTLVDEGWDSFGWR